MPTSAGGRPGFFIEIVVFGPPPLFLFRQGIHHDVDGNGKTISILNKWVLRRRDIDVIKPRFPAI